MWAYFRWILVWFFVVVCLRLLLKIHVFVLIFISWFLLSIQNPLRLKVRAKLDFKIASKNIYIYIDTNMWFSFFIEKLCRWERKGVCVCVCMLWGMKEGGFFKRQIFISYGCVFNRSCSNFLLALYNWYYDFNHRRFVLHSIQFIFYIYKTSECWFIYLFFRLKIGFGLLLLLV